MRGQKASPRLMLALAAGAVLLLAILSDFDPVQLSSIAELGNEEPGEVAAIVVRCRPCAGGFLLNLTDGEGGWADAFCPRDVRSDPVVNGSSVRLVVQRSADDPDFLYVERLIVLAAPDGKD